MSKPVNVTSADFENRVLRSPQPVVVDFWAAWCGPCRMMAPVLEDLAADLDGQVAFAKLNVDENPGVAELYGISGIPALVVFANGEEAGRIVGFMPKAHILHNLQALLPETPVEAALLAQ